MESIGIKTEYVEYDYEMYRHFFLRYTKLGRKSKGHKVAKKNPNDILYVFDHYSVEDRDRVITHPVLGKLYMLLFYTLLPIYYR